MGGAPAVDGQCVHAIRTIFCSYIRKPSTRHSCRTSSDLLSHGLEAAALTISAVAHYSSHRVVFPALQRSHQVLGNKADSPGSDGAALQEMPAQPLGCYRAILPQRAAPLRMAPDTSLAMPSCEVALGPSRGPHSIRSISAQCVTARA